MSTNVGYLDHAATTALNDAAREGLLRGLNHVGNASSLHAGGREARRHLEEARELIATCTGARPSEVIFTSGGTESDNLAVVGTYRHRRAADSQRRRLVVAAYEHSAVLDSVEYLVKRESAVVTWVPCTPTGQVTPEALREAIAADGGPHTVALIAVMWVNNEVGSINDLPTLGAVAAEHELPLHTDAVQALSVAPLSFAESQATTLALTGHKLGAPVGIGVLVAKRDAQLDPLSFGGGQERQLRSGTVPVALAMSLAAAMEQVVATRPEYVARVVALRDRLLEGVIASVPGARPTGGWEPGNVTTRSASHAHVLLPDCEGDSLLYLLDAAGVHCSTGSACHAGIPQPSHVLLAMGYSTEEARGALRLTLGHASTDADVDLVLRALPEAAARAQRAHNAR